MSELTAGFENLEDTKPKDPFDRKITTTTIRDPATQVDYPILTKWSPNTIANNILTYTTLNGYCGIINCGVSGSGKTSWTEYLIHALHTRMDSPVVIKWFHKDDITKLKNVINSLQKGINHILIFDDASFAMEQLPREEVFEIMRELTFVRHTVMANVICIINMHYSKAVTKFFRNVPFLFLTSISPEEQQTFIDIFGPYSKWKFYNFSRYYKSMMLKGSCRISIDQWTGKGISLYTNRPFRLGLACQLGSPNFFVYLKDSCQVCRENFSEKTGEKYNVSQLIEELKSSYGIDKTRSVIRWFLFANKGFKTPDAKNRALYNDLAKFDQRYDIDWSKVSDEIEDTLKRKTRKRYKRRSSPSTTKEPVPEIQEVSREFFTN